MTVRNLVTGMTIRGGSLVLGAATAVVVAHVLDQRGVAQSLVAISLGTMISVVGQAGVPAVLAHRVARVRVGSSSVDELRDDLRQAAVYLTGLMAVISLAGALRLPVGPQHLIPGGSVTMLLAAVVMGGGRAASRILSETNKGYGHVTIAGVGADLMGPTVGLLGVAVLALLVEPSGDAVVWTLAFGWCAAVAFAWWRAPVRPGVRRRSALREPYREVFGVVAIISILNVGIQQAHVLIAGMTLTVAGASVFAAVSRLAALTGTPLILISAVASPDVGVALQSRDRERIKAMETQLQAVTGLLLIAGLSVLALFWIGGSPLLGLMFGANYRPGHLELVLLALGPLASLSTGVAGMCLMQAGLRRKLLADTVVGSAIAIAAMAIGATSGGGVGLAAGYAFGQFLMNLIVLRSCHQLLGVAPFARPVLGLRAAAGRVLARR